MSLIKFSSILDYDFGIEPASIINDRKQLVKRGSDYSHLKFERTPNQTDVHLIALGAYEGTGQNKNSDIFFEDDCRKYHDTFVKAGRALHRNHKNKPSDKKYGNIKCSYYNEPMKRIELIVGHDNDTAADILEEIEKKGQADYSMACSVPFDRCSICKHEAKTEDDRCIHIPNQLGEITKEGKMVGMENVRPRWFEISHVKRGACRIGKSLRVLMYGKEKKASYSYDEIKDDLYIPSLLSEPSIFLSKKASDKRSLLQKLSVLEKRVDAVAKGSINNSEDKVIDSKLKTPSPELSAEALDEIRKIKPSQLFRVLADNGIILDPKNFLNYAFDKEYTDEEENGLKGFLPSIFRKIESDEDEGDVVNDEKFEPDMLSSIPFGLKKLVEGLTSDHSLFSEPSHHRIIRIMIIGKPVQKTKDTEVTKKASIYALAKAYTAYKLAALNYLQDNNKLNEEVLMNSIIQNRQ